MKKQLLAILFIYMFVMVGVAESQSAETMREKQIALKGLSIGMDMDAAQKICERFAGKNWTVSRIEARNQLIDDNAETLRRHKLPIVGKQGFLIKNKGGFLDGYGFVSEDGGNGTVAQILFSGELTDYLYSSAEVHADFFVEDFTKHFGLPPLSWIQYGWTYFSPRGYELTIMNDKTIDIKKSDPGKSFRRKINFD
jgi:hypothetical protein